MGKFEVIEEKESDLKKHLIELDGERYLVSTVDLLPPEMKVAFNEKIVDKVMEKGKYETCIFPFEEDEPKLEDSLYSRRYNSKEEALKGHEKILGEIKNGKINL